MKRKSNKSKLTLEPHQRVELYIGENRILVDQGITALLTLMNKVPGISTTNSCQGLSDELNVHGYVQFVGPSASMLIKGLVERVYSLGVKWKRAHQHVCRGCRSSLSITTAVRLSYMVLPASSSCATS